VIEWARNVFTTDTDWDRFFDLALEAEPGADGLRMRPDFSSRAGGELTRLSLHHHTSEIIRAVLEGVASAARAKLGELAAPEVCFATGAASANDRWMQVMADVSGRTVRPLLQSQTGLWGTALAAGAGAGIYDDVLAAARKHRRVRAQFEPDPALRDTYDEVYEEYRVRQIPNEE
jgi:sugar (pentulose or hexulose) kinase